MDNKPFEISIRWSTPVDLDLCVFYKAADGSIGGVFSDEFRSNPADLGRLSAFPFMQHMGDMKEPHPGQQGCEYVKIERPELFERLDVVVINYEEAIDLLDVDYADPEGLCTIGNGNIKSEPTGSGQAYHVATMQRGSSGRLELHPVNRVVSLKEAYDSIPGFPLICE